MTTMTAMTTVTTKLENAIRIIAKNKKAVMALKILTAAIFAAMLTFTFDSVAHAATAKGGPDLTAATHPVLGLINSLVNPLLLIVGAGGVIFCIILGVKYATAEEPQEREKRKQSLKTAIIGYLLIFVLVVVLKLSIGPLTTWMTNNSSTTATTAAK